MQRSSRTRAAVALSAVMLAALVVTPRSLGGGIATNREEARLAGLINGFRVAHGLPPLRVGPRLHAAARRHSQDMLRRGYFAHGDLESRLRAFGVRASIVGENIAWGNGPYGAPRGILHTWTTSPGHRANLLERRFRRIGLGIVVGTFAGYPRTRVVTADFAG